MCECECSHFAPELSWFWCREGIMGRLLAGCGLCCSAPWVGTHSATRQQQQHCATQEWAGPDPVAQDAEVQRRLSVEPRMPFLLQMYCWDLVVQQLQSLPWLFLIAWLFDIAVFFFYFWGEKILSSNHTYLIAAIGATLNGPCLSSVMVMIRRLYL